MEKGNKKALIVGIVGIVLAILLLAGLALLVIPLFSTPSPQANEATPTETTAPQVLGYDLYWNLDREQFDGKSEGGMSSREPSSDGYFYIRFLLDGKEVTLKAPNRRMVNAIDSQSLMGFEVDADGVITKVLSLDDMPLEKVGWNFYVQSASTGGKVIKLNSSETYEGMEIMLENRNDALIMDMTGSEGEIGCAAIPVEGDRVYAVQNLNGVLTHLFIYERPTFMFYHEGYCQHCDETVQWGEWLHTDRMPYRTGHYQLMTDVTMKTSQPVNSENQNICLDLNGKRVDGAKDSRIYPISKSGCVLAIMDTSEAQTGTLAAHGDKCPNGACVFLDGGQLNLYQGILDASDAASESNGVALNVTANTYFYMNGGKIIGGTALPRYDATSKKYSAGLGGSLLVAGKFVMTGGTIEGGYAKAATTYSGGKATLSRGMGGNLFVSSKATVELKGGVIKNGRAGTLGGNIYMDGSSTMTIDGGRIEGGRTVNKEKNGGNLYIGGTTANVVMNSGSITGGRTYQNAGNLYVYGTFTMNGGTISGGVCIDPETGNRHATRATWNVFVVNGTMNVNGGFIDGGVAVTDTSTTDGRQATVVLRGSARIQSKEAGRANLTINTGGLPRVVVKTLNDKAMIGVNTTRGLFSDPTDIANVDNFFSDLDGAQIIHTENGLVLGKHACVCGQEETHKPGCDGTKYMWSPWSSATTLPTAEGNYFLTKDVTVTGQTVVPTQTTVRLDLNGKNITYAVPATRSDGFRVYRAEFGANLVLTDATEAPGTVTVKMMPANELKAALDELVAAGTTTQAQADSIMGAQAAGNTGMLLWARGGNISVHGGIYDNSHNTGSQNGMTITANGESSGGVAYPASFTLWDGVIKCATTSGYGAGINATSSATVNIHGGIIEGGVSTKNYGGNIYVAGTLLMDGGVIRDGKSLLGGGNLAVVGAKANATITGDAQILNGVGGDATVEGDYGRGGNIRLNTAGATLTIDGNALISGGTCYRSGSGKAGYGGNINTTANTIVNINGGVIENGVSTYRGGSIYLCGQLNMTGGVIRGGQSTDDGGNIYAISGGVANLSGGSIEGGIAGTNGGNIGTQKGAVVNLTGATISGGKGILGGNLYLLGSPLTMSAGSITGGTAETAASANIAQLSGAATITGGTVDGGYYVQDDVACTVAISGNTTIYKESATGLTLGEETSEALKLQLSFGALAETAKVSISVPSGDKSFATLTEACGESWKTTVLADDATKTIYQFGSVLTFKEPGVGDCICGASKNGGEHAPGCESEGILPWVEWTDELAAEQNGEGKTAANSVPSVSGYYYLTKDIQLTDAYTLTENFTLYLDLNGNAIKAAADKRAFQVSYKNAKLVITDTSIEGAGFIQGGNIGTKGGGSIYLGNTYATVILFRGNIVGGTGKYGGNVYANPGRFIMNGGTVSGGTTTTSGGNIALENAASFIMNGGTVTGGKTDGKGGNVSLYGGTKTALLELNGGSILDGTAVSGGNLRAGQGGQIVISGGTVSGGTATTEGTNIFTESTATLEITGGTVGGGIHYGSTGTLTLSGAPHIEAETGASIFIPTGKKLTLGELTEGAQIGVTLEDTTATFTDAVDTSVTDYFFSDDPNMLVIHTESGLTLTPGYCICGASKNGGEHAPGCQEEGRAFVWTEWNDTLAAEQNGAGKTASNSLPKVAGKYYLTKDIQLTANYSVAADFDLYLDLNGKSIKAASGYRAFHVSSQNAKLVITDTSAEGAGFIQGSNLGTKGGGTIYIGNTYATAVLFRGHIVGGTAKYGGNVYANPGRFIMNGGTVSGGTTTTSGGNIALENAASFIMNGGTVTGGKTDGKGGNVSIYGGSKTALLELNGGSILDGTAVSGGNLRAGQGGKIVITGGTVSGGTATTEGTNIFAESTATLEITGGTVGGGIHYGSTGTLTLSGAPKIKAESGAGIYIPAGKKLTVGALADGANICVTLEEPGAAFTGVLSEDFAEFFESDDPQLFPISTTEGLKLVEGYCLCGASKLGGEHAPGCQEEGRAFQWTDWTDALAAEQNGAGKTAANSLPKLAGKYRLTKDIQLTANYSVAADFELYLDLNGKSIKAASGYRAFHVSSNNAKLVITDTSAEGKGFIQGSNMGTKGGGTIYIGNTYATVILFRGSIVGGTAKYGGNVYANPGRFIMNGGNVSGGTATTSGGNIALENTSSFIMNGGTVTGGKTDGKGGNVSLYGGTKTALLEMTGGSILNGTAVSGGNLRAGQGGKIVITGGSVSGGTATTEGTNIFKESTGTYTITGGTVEGLYPTE